MSVEKRLKNLDLLFSKMRKKIENLDENEASWVKLLDDENINEVSIALLTMETPSGIKTADRKALNNKFSLGAMEIQVLTSCWATGGC